MPVNKFNQPVGEIVDGWIPARLPGTDGINPDPEHDFFHGYQQLRLERMTADHLPQLWEMLQQEPDASIWTYLPYGPFDSLASFTHWQQQFVGDNSHFPWVILKNDTPVGWISLMAVQPAHGSIEIGHVYYSPDLRQTASGTLVIWLLLRYVQQLGYRRIEWKCNNLNRPSKQAAQRYGFRFEGVFRNAAVIKGRSRDTAWYSVTDTELEPRLKRLEGWLAQKNFDEEGRQRRALSSYPLR